ncbi:MAG: RsmB/NOP family class I SAM-dependent RNA methyltransferase [Candidatus Lokiarchaeota archaeon]|nr:RsmB/NOP family class I SAM-dependent RNA methyltransferase [Candidatus Lokiarchaeota archaeon]
MSQNQELAQNLAKEYGYLPYMIERYLQFLGVDGTIDLLKANEIPLIPSIRVNTLKIKTPDLKIRMEQKGFELSPIDWIPYAYNVIKESFNLGSTHEFLQGYYYIQNLASMLAAVILNPKPGDVVIDMCAAPGSKATHLAQLMKNEGTLILIDRNKARIPALEINLRRLGIINSIVINMDAVNLSNLNIKADKILLDAPCTGEGLIRQDPNRKKSRKARDIEKMASIQKKLLKAGLKSLKPEGELLYSTCSIAPEENELVIYDVLEEKSSFKISEISKTYGVSGLTEVFGKNLREDLGYSQRLYPHLHDTIGFYLCLLERTN